MRKFLAAALTPERRFAAVVMMVCASLGAASGLESELDSTQLNGLELDHSVTQMHSTTGMSQAFKEGPLEGAITIVPASKLSLKSANKDSNAKSEVLGEALGAGAGTKKEAVAAAADAKKEATNAKEEAAKAKKEAASAKEEVAKTKKDAKREAVAAAVFQCDVSSKSRATAWASCIRLPGDPGVHFWNPKKSEWRCQGVATNCNSFAEVTIPAFNPVLNV